VLLRSEIGLRGRYWSSYGSSAFQGVGRVKMWHFRGPVVSTMGVWRRQAARQFHAFVPRRRLGSTGTFVVMVASDGGGWIIRAGL
jgi:hypothetical protein